jgi:hypothetical protein
MIEQAATAVQRASARLTLYAPAGFRPNHSLWPRLLNDHGHSKVRWDVDWNVWLDSSHQVTDDFADP